MNVLVRADETVINDEDEFSNTALHLASMEGHVRVVDALIEAGADITARNQSQWTPLDCCAANGYVKTAAALLDADSPVDPTDKASVRIASDFMKINAFQILTVWLKVVLDHFGHFSNICCMLHILMQMFVFKILHVAASLTK